MRLVVILPVLVAELELGAPPHCQFPFLLVELRRLPDTVRAAVIGALVDRHLLSHFPGKERMEAIRAVVLGLLLEPPLYLKELPADLAQKLAPLLPVVVVEIVVRGIADRTNNQFWDCVRLGPAPDRIKRFTVKRLVLS
jgi:hypothetical protein